MKRYLALVSRPAEFDQELIASHKRYLQSMLDAGALQLSGPFGEMPGGAYMFLAADRAAAEAVVAADPLLADGRAAIELREWVIRLDATKVHA